MKNLLMPLLFLIFGTFSKASSDLLVFVSLSMPEASLKSLFKEASQKGGRLLVRGFYKNSFKEMKAKMDGLQINVDVDPTLFETYHIQKVPTFVLRVEDKAVKCAGNVSLTHALEVLQS